MNNLFFPLRGILFPVNLLSDQTRAFIWWNLVDVRWQIKFPISLITSVWSPEKRHGARSAPRRCRRRRRRRPPSPSSLLTPPPASASSTAATTTAAARSYATAATGSCRQLYNSPSPEAAQGAAADLCRHLLRCRRRRRRGSAAGRWRRWRGRRSLCWAAAASWLGRRRGAVWRRRRSTEARCSGRLHGRHRRGRRDLRPSSGSSSHTCCQ